MAAVFEDHQRIVGRGAKTHLHPRQSPMQRHMIRRIVPLDNIPSDSSRVCDEEDLKSLKRERHSGPLTYVNLSYRTNLIVISDNTLYNFDLSSTCLDALSLTKHFQSDTSDSSGSLVAGSSRSPLSSPCKLLAIPGWLRYICERNNGVLACDVVLSGRSRMNLGNRMLRPFSGALETDPWAARDTGLKVIL